MTWFLAYHSWLVISAPSWHYTKATLSSQVLVYTCLRNLLNSWWVVSFILILIRCMSAFRDAFRCRPCQGRSTDEGGHHRLSNDVIWSEGSQASCTCVVFLATWRCASNSECLLLNLEGVWASGRFRYIFVSVGSEEKELICLGGYESEVRSDTSPVRDCWAAMKLFQ